jgi:neutrophil factor 2
LCSNYTQLGLAFTLFSAEVLFNKGLSLIYMGQIDEGMLELQDAARAKATEEHNVIDEAIRDRGEGYTVFSIVRRLLLPRNLSILNWPCQPVGVLYRPSEMKLKNAKTRDFLGKAVRPNFLYHLRTVIYGVSETRRNGESERSLHHVLWCH